jgi:hypothetical protein
LREKTGKNEIHACYKEDHTKNMIIGVTSNTRFEPTKHILTDRNGALDLGAARHGHDAVALLLLVVAHPDVLVEVVIRPEDGDPVVVAVAGRRVGGDLDLGDEEPLPQREGDAHGRARRDDHVRHRGDHI